MSERGASKQDGAMDAFIEAMFGSAHRMRNAWRVAWTGLAESERVTTPAEADALAQEMADWDRRNSDIRAKYPRAIFQWNELESRARAHRVRFSNHVQAHHRAALLDFLDNPDAPTRLDVGHLSWIHVTDANGRYTYDPAHPAARAVHRFNSRIYPDLFSPDRNAWSDEQWNRAEQDNERRLAIWEKVQAKADRRAIIPAEPEQMPYGYEYPSSPVRGQDGKSPLLRSNARPPRDVA